MSYQVVKSKRAPLTWSGAVAFYPTRDILNYDNTPGFHRGAAIRPNRCDMYRQQTSASGTYNAYVGPVVAPNLDGDIYWPSPHPVFESSAPAEALNIARSRFLGKARGNTASLGITAATAKQSFAMIQARTVELKTRAVAEVELQSRLSARKRAMRWTRKGGDYYLEGLFGWMPLIKDISDAAAAVVEEIPEDIWLRASGLAYHSGVPLSNAYNRSDYGEYGYDITTSCTATCRATITARVIVDNHNALLANKLGLINIPAIATDLIPWSWVTGMFWNQSAFLGQLTDTVGLTMRDMSITQNFHSALAWSSTGRRSRFGANASGNQVLRRKLRYLTNDLPSVTPQARVPELSWGLAATGLALVAQRANRLAGLAVAAKRWIAQAK